MKFTLEFCYSHSLLMCPRSRQLTPPLIQNALLGACAFLYQEESLRAQKDWRASASFQYLATSPAPDRQVRHLGKLCVRITLSVVTMLVKRCHRVLTFDSCVFNQDPQVIGPKVWVGHIMNWFGFWYWAELSFEWIWISIRARLHYSMINFPFVKRIHVQLLCL